MWLINWIFNLFKRPPKVKCGKCKKIIIGKSAVILSTPLSNKEDLVVKYNICESCYCDLCGWILKG